VEKTSLAAGFLGPMAAVQARSQCYSSHRSRTYGCGSTRSHKILLAAVPKRTPAKSELMAAVLYKNRSHKSTFGCGFWGNPSQKYFFKKKKFVLYIFIHI